MNFPENTVGLLVAQSDDFFKGSIIIEGRMNEKRY